MGTYVRTRPELLTAAEAAQELRVSIPTVYRYVRAGTLRAARTGLANNSQLRIRHEDIDALLWSPRPGEAK